MLTENASLLLLSIAKIELVPMRSYGDKPTEFMRMVPGGILPAITIEKSNGQQQVITESGVIMELLDQWHPASEGYKPMLPEESDQSGWKRYNQLARLERELFSYWCNLSHDTSVDQASSKDS